MKKMDNKGFSLIELIIVIAIMAVLVAVIAPNLTSYLGSSKKKTDNSNADTIENVLNNQLQAYCSDEKIEAAANTDALMTAYADIDAIIAKASATPSTGYDSQFEQNVKNNLPAKYLDANGKMITKQKDYYFKVVITGTYDEGYTAKVTCEKKTT